MSKEDRRKEAIKPYDKRENFEHISPNETALWPPQDYDHLGYLFLGHIV